MTQAVWETNEIVVTTSGCFTAHHRLETAAGTLGEFTFPVFRTHAVFCAADGRRLLARHASLWRDRHELREGDSREGAPCPCSPRPARPASGAAPSSSGLAVRSICSSQPTFGSGAGD